MTLTAAEATRRTTTNDRAARPYVTTDVNGATYVAYTTMVLGRRLNADLARLGY